MNFGNNNSVLPGVMITAGTAIGAGMFSLPVVSSGMWFILSLFCLAGLWYLNYLSALYLLEANFQFSPGASFDTIVTKILGKTWNALTGLSICFLFYILLYAYFSAFGNIASHTLGIKLFGGGQWSDGLMSLLFGGLLAIIVWLSTAAVGRISTILVTGMVISFVISMSGYALQVEASKLFDVANEDSNYLPFLWAALPYFMTSFGFSNIVPSLYKFYGRKPQIIKNGLLYGSLLALFVYTIFIFVFFGNISRDGFIAINEAGGNMGHLVDAIQQNGGNKMTDFVLNLFSNFAIISSFLGVGLGLFDYLADKFSFEDNPKGRFYTACITFLPSGIFSFFFPNGFIAAIGFAGLVVIFGFYIVTFLMVKKTRKLGETGEYKVGGGNSLLIIFLMGSLLVGTCQILNMLGYLPSW